MEICDRCYHKGDYRPSTKKITTNTHESFSFCESCYSEFGEFLEWKLNIKGKNKTKKEKIKPKK